MSTQQLSEGELRTWLKNWVASHTNVSAQTISDDRPLEEYGLSSRDAVALSGELEDLLGQSIDATLAYNHPTIAALTDYLLNGPGELTAPPVSDRATSAQPGADIAVVGVAVHLPAGAHNADALWDVLASGTDATSELPEGRWSEYDGDDTIAAALQNMPTRGGYLDDIKSFDAEFFGLSPREAQMVDPQQRLALELTWQVCEHARIPANTLKGTNTGVFIGSVANDYAMLIGADSSSASPYAVTGTASSIIANRVNYTFDFRGPSVTLDTACSSSLVAVHNAVQSLRLGETDTAIAGGINILASPVPSVGFAQTGGVLSEDGRIKAFSSTADGICRGEGGGLFLLKRVSDAEAAGDNILAVIKGSAVNSDGRSNGITAPNTDAQIEMLQAAYADAGIAPSQLDYVEAHGTGTLLGDPIEATALGNTCGYGRDEHQPLLIGSAKTNFGHLEGAAGAVGMAKVILGFNRQEIAPTINYAGPNPYIDFERLNLHVTDTPMDWPRYSGVATAGVSGFGFGGTNAHVVLSEYTPPAVSAEKPVENTPTIVAISGSVPSRRKAAAASVLQWIDNNPTVSLQDISRTLATRSHQRSRAAIVCSTREEAIEGLQAVAAGTPAAHVVTADGPATKGAVFVFSGFGAQHRLMAKELYLGLPLFASHIDKVDAVIEWEAGYSIKDMFLNDEVTYQVENAQIGIFAIQVALADTFKDMGITPAAVIGHSMGEAAASYVSGGLPLEEAVRVICVRSRLMGEAEAEVSDEDAGAMALVEYSATEVDQIISERPEFASIEPAVYAAPTHTTIGGRAQPVQEFVNWATEQGKMARLLQVRGAGHTSDVDMLLGDLAAELSGLNAGKLATELFSSVDKQVHYRVGSGPLHHTEYWTKGMRHSVWFTQAVATACRSGYTTYIELAPNPVAIMSVAATCFDEGIAEPELFFTLKRKEPEVHTLLTSIGQLYVHGHCNDLRPVSAVFNGPGDYANLPGMPWARKEYWTTATVGGSSSVATLPGTHVSLPGGKHAWNVLASAAPSTEAVLESAALSLYDSVEIADITESVVLPAAGELCVLLEGEADSGHITIHSDDTLVAAAHFTAAAKKSSYQAYRPVPDMADIDDIEVDTADESALWDKDSGETIEQRMRTIIGEAMGYSAEDMPMELPLIELGLDSLMAVRIKNRVEYEFSIPPLQLQAMRDAALKDVVQMVTYAIENPEEVQKLADGQVSNAEDLLAQAAGDVPAALGQMANSQGSLDDAAASIGVAPRDAAERVALAVWVNSEGSSPGGVTTEFGAVDEASAEKLAQALNERVNEPIDAKDLVGATCIEHIANIVRPALETAVEGNIRTLRAASDTATGIPVFLFHPAGGSSSVYAPLTRALPESTPVYGVERLEGEIPDRAAQYLDEIMAIGGQGPYVLAGWSFGGALAVEVAKQLTDKGATIALIGLLDTVKPAQEVPNTMEETVTRWQRYAAFAKKTYGFEFEIPQEFLEEHGEDGVLAMLMGMLANTDLNVGAGVMEHQRASFVDTRLVEKVDFASWKNIGSTVPFVLYRAERMHDGAIELEPRYADINPDGGWSAIVEDLEIVHLTGDHLAIVDEPEVGKVGAHLTGKLTELASERT